jgi:hypothetical protein
MIHPTDFLDPSVLPDRMETNNAASAAFCQMRQRCSGKYCRAPRSAFTALHVITPYAGAKH